MKTNRLLIYIVTWLISVVPILGQQKSIVRVDAMANKPSSYKLLDWKALTKNYDNFIFDTSKTGTYLPLSSVRDADGVNYSDVKNIGMHTFVGHTEANAAEAINIMPAVVGASLVGVDKTNHLGQNWVVKLKDFFNKKNGQNVYLNNYSAGTGGDWWYELMPNVFFYQLYSLYPNADNDFTQQVVTVADRQLDVLYKLGGKLYPWTAPNMNYRAFNLLTGQPTSGSIPEPEASGAIAWILYQAYQHTGNAKYKEGAELALSFLQDWTTNPSYEIQLPYGIVTAARLNAEEGTSYNVDKFLNWAFSSGSGTLRNWGVIVGEWNGYDMTGLIGEAKENGDDYAFLMNGFQHAAALAPVAKYDKRYAKALAKWILHLASSSRYFYPGEMPEANQDAVSLAWSKTNVSTSCIPYEAIKQKWEGKTPYAMGDALKGGWAATNLSLYSGSSVGYLASIISPTNVDAVLQIDLNATDFTGANTYPNYLYYNPNATAENINITLPSGTYAIYDAISETVLNTSASGTYSFSLPANDIRLLVLYPSGSTTQQDGNMLKVVGGNVVDFHKGYTYNTSYRIKSFSADKMQVNANEALTLNCLVENESGAVTYKWYVDGNLVSGQTQSSYNWTPTQGGKYKVKATATNNGKELTTHELEIVAIGGDFVIPAISELKVNGNEPFDLGSVVNIQATTNAPNATVTWECNGGILANTNGLTPAWTLPSLAGTYSITLTIENALGKVSSTKDVLVKDLNSGGESHLPIVYYSFNGDAKNKAQDAFHATSIGAVLTTDKRGNPDSAYRLANNTQYFNVPNDNALNFVNEMTLSFWIKPEDLGREQYVISHGSWEQRYKISITPENKLIMTLKTTGGIVDLADETPLVQNQFYHYAVVYTGTSLEIYRNGQLVNSRAQTGTIGKSANSLTIGRMNASEANYAFVGVIDEFRLYDVALSAAEVSTLPDSWDLGTGGDLSIEKLTVNGEDLDWDVTTRYVIPCGVDIQNVPVTIVPAAGTVLSIESNTIVEMEKPSVKTVKFTISSADGSESQEYTLIIEKRFAFDKLVTQKWNNLLTVNNNASTNGGFNFTAYKWFKDGSEIGDKQYYSAGKRTTDQLDPNAEYMVQVTTDEGVTLQTCSAQPNIVSSRSFVMYPNPVKAGEPATVDTGIFVEDFQKGKLQVYSMFGQLILEQEVNAPVFTFTMNAQGTYALKLLVDDGRSFDSKFIVK